MNSKILFPVFFSLILNVSTYSLNPITKYSLNDCKPSNQYFDVTTLECKDCPPNSQSLDGFNCRCNKNSYFITNNGGGSITCALCSSGLVQSSDGFQCVKDSCINSDFSADYNLQGDFLNPTECIKCNPTSSILINNSCRSCKPFIFLDSDLTSLQSINCNSNFLFPSGGFFFLTQVVDNEPTNFNIQFGSERIESWYFKEYAKSSYRTCRNAKRRNLTSCQILSNMCVLNLYNSFSFSQGQVSVDVCTAYDELDTNANRTLFNLPWIKYTETLGEYKKNYLQNGIFLKLKFSGKCNSNNLRFISAEYNLAGRLVRYDKFDISKLQLCNLKSNYAKVSSVSPFTTTNLVQKCSLNLEDLFELADNQDLLFYDLYLEYSNGSMLPIPVKILNFEDNRATNEDFHKLQRRFFLVETISSKLKADSPSVYIRFAKSIKIQFDLVKGKSNGEIYPPLILIEYDFAKRENASKEVQISFSIEYKMQVDSFMLVVFVLIGLFASMAFLWSCLRIWNWNRRSGRFAIDLITIFKFIMFLIGSTANAIFVVLVLTSLYWLIVYRGQSDVVVFLPDTNQEKLFGIFLIIAFVLKFLDIIYLTFLQSSYDIFFIDWERPKVEAKYALASELSVNKKGETKKAETNVDFVKEQIKEQNKISCWRTLFVANEWNELQIFRKLNTTLQLVFVLFFLKVVNLEVLTLKDCNSSLIRDQNDYQAPYSAILRIAMGSAIYLAVGAIQWFLYTFIYSRCIEDKIGQFVDFCSVSNISMFIMTHTQFGYYIHGRSPHGQADTSMQQMTQALIKEEIDVMAKRGLEQNSDHQSFSILVPVRLSRQYAKVMAPLNQKRAVNQTFRRDQINATNEFEKRMLAYTQLNRFLISFIDNTLRNMNYTIVTRNFFENIFDFEFKEPISNGYFYKEAICCGKERTFFIFDLLLFLIIDYLAQNYILSAFVVYLVTKFIQTIRSDMGKRNLSRKTLVDKRFLI